MASKLVAVSDFVRRQIKGSGKSYSEELSFDEIAVHAEEQYLKGNYRNGYRDGVVLVQVESELTDKFYCPFVKLTEDTQLSAQLVRRRDEEEPYIQIRAQKGEPFPASKVELVLYRHDVLVENDEQTTSAEWELISINAVPVGVDDLPMGPVTMMRNQLELPGGTKAQYSSEEWAKSVRFWQRYAALEPDK